MLHACGRRDYDELAARLSELGGPGHYQLHAYITPFARRARGRRPGAWRARAARCFELAAAGLPAILVPYPHATADHQTSNAALMAEAGAAVMVPDAELDGSAARARGGRAARRALQLAAMAEAARRASRPDAAERVADELLRLAG